MWILKDYLISLLIFYKFYYDPEDGWGAIIFAVDISLEGFGATLGQYNNKSRKRVARYESGFWNSFEHNYDTIKRECRGIFKSLYKLKFWLYRVYFILETDVNVLVIQLNHIATNLPGIFITR